MKVLIAGGSGFLGTALRASLVGDGQDALILTRSAPRTPYHVQWDGRTTRGWGHLVNEVDAVVNLTGYGLEHWPWTRHRKQKFLESRVIPGRALVSAIQQAVKRPTVFVQTSGINRYGLRGESTADETTPAADDFLAQLTIPWEEATRPVEELGLRRVILRNAVVLSLDGGLLPLLVLPARLFLGGRFGTGRQAMPWVHLADQTRAMRFALENERVVGPLNVIAPQATSQAEFMQAVAQVLRRPYWFHVPGFLLRWVLGEMSILLTEGRYSAPKRLIELGFRFQFGTLDAALNDLLVRDSRP